MKKIMNKILLSSFILVIFLLISPSRFLVVAEQIRFVPHFRANWPHLDRPNTYDYAPSGIIEDNHWKVWFCGGDNDEGRIPGDSIFFWKLTPSGQEGTQKVLPNSQDNIKEDGRHACAPTITKHSNPYIQNGKELYKMYYECARRFYDKQTENVVEGFTQICHAISEDGINWKKYNAEIWDNTHQYGDLNTPPTPVIKVNQKILTNCQYEFSEGKHKILGSCLENLTNYGVGHPSALVKKIGSGQQVWLYYFDSKGEWPGKVYLAKSWDGFHFDPPIETNLANPVDVKYFEIQTENHPGFFVATYGIYDDNYFAYSFDGIYWVWYGNVANKDLVKIGKAIPEHQIAYAQPGILGDKFGTSDSTFVNILSGEGERGSLWWESAGLWLIQGRFLGEKYLLENYSSPNSQTDLNGDGKVNGFDFGFMAKL